MAKTLLETFVLRRASIYATPAAATDTLKRVYGDLTDGEDGVVPAVEIQKWNGAAQVFQIADHPIHSDTPTVYVNDIAVAGGGVWTFSASTNFEGQGTVAILTFSADQTGKRVSVKCKGALNAALALIENLAEIVYDVLVTTHGLTWEWDAVAYAHAFADCASLGYLGGGVILDDGDPATLADGIVKPLGAATVGGDGRLRLFIEMLPAAPVPEEIFDPHEVEAVFTHALDAIVNDIQLSHQFNWRKRVFSSLERQYDGFYAPGPDAQSRAEYGTRTQMLEAPWLRTTAAASAGVATLLALRKRPRWDIALTGANFKGQLQQPADVVAFSSPVMAGGGAIGQPGDRRLMRVRQVDLGLSRGGVTLSGYDLERNWWILSYPLDGTRVLDGSWKLGANAGPR